MGWMQKLCEAYDAAIECDQSNEEAKLVPVGFIRKPVKYHVVLDKNGEFVSADELIVKKNENDKKGQPPVLNIPSTLKAQSRTGDKGMPFPLIDQMKYLVYEDERNSYRFELYMNQLKDWCDQSDAPECLRIVYTYMDKHTLLSDLKSQPNLNVKYNKNSADKSDYGTDGKSMVCFSVQSRDASSDDLWMRSDVIESWSRYYEQQLTGEKKLCYVEGKKLPTTTNYPKVQGNAKLISAKDAQYPLLYKGRFMEDSGAVCISSDAMVRAHNTLEWLITRQGFQKYGITWVVWNTNNTHMTVPIDDYKFGFMEEDEDDEDEENAALAIDTFKGYAQAVNDAALGYKFNLDGWNAGRVNYVVILGMEAATDGRLSVIYYQECPGNDYVERLKKWYESCCWWHYNRIKGKTEIASPTTKEIVTAVLGNECVKRANKGNSSNPNAKLVRELMSWLLACIVDKRQLPFSMIQNAFRQACMPLSFTTGSNKSWSRYEWQKSVNTACAMFRCYNLRRVRPHGEIFDPELQQKSHDRDYLYGRLFAVADLAEKEAKKSEKERPTNAVMLMQKFVQRPFETWQTIHEKLMPTFRDMGEGAKRYIIAFEEIEQLFLPEDRLSRKPLSYAFLQGYSSQYQYWYTKKDNAVKEETPSKASIIYEAPTTRSELYGCLLAIADEIENKAVDDNERFARTNAMQMMRTFAARPYETWARLHDKLIPYIEKLGDKAGYYQYLIARIEEQFTLEEREQRQPLDASYLHGYYGMLKTFYQTTEYVWNPQACEENPKDMRSAYYGTMLGAADWTEQRAMLKRSNGREDKEKRTTNALRYMAAFAQKPASAWEFLKVKLKPYQRYAPIGEVLTQAEAQIIQNGWNTNEPISSIYLHYYYAQRNRKGEKDNEQLNKQD